MKVYPSIISGRFTPFEEFKAHVFDKIDGSNIRVEYSSKAGFYKFGTRNRLVDRTDPEFGIVLDLFDRDWGESLSVHLYKHKIAKCILFFEYWGKGSFAGEHDPNDESRKLTLIDASIYKLGFLPPERYLKIFGDLDSAKYLGEMWFDKELVDKVYREELPGVTFEGIVGKAMGKQGPIMVKAKTKGWLELVGEKFAYDKAQRLINS